MNVIMQLQEGITGFETYERVELPSETEKDEPYSTNSPLEVTNNREIEIEEKEVKPAVYADKDEFFHTKQNPAQLQFSTKVAMVFSILVAYLFFPRRKQQQ